jgi:uncharacterized membrane protein
MLRSLSARFKRYGWLLAAGALLVFVAILFGRRRWTKRARAGVSEALRRAHEADVEVEVAKRKLDQEAEAEIAQIRRTLAEEVSEIELRTADRRAKLTDDGDELLEAYRRRARELGL